MSRPLEEITKDYSQAFAELGVAYFDQCTTIPNKIQKLQEKLSVLLVEAEVAKAKQGE